MEYLKLLYYGCFYQALMEDRALRSLLNPIFRKLMLAIPRWIPSAKRNLAQKGKTPEEAADEFIKLNDKFSEANFMYEFEYHTGISFFFFFILVWVTILVLLRRIFGTDWFGFQICGNGPNAVIETAAVMFFAIVSTLLLQVKIGTDKNEKVFRKQPKKLQKKAFRVYLISWGVVILLSAIVWGYDWITNMH